MMYVEIIKKFFLADWSELMGVWVISASWAQKAFDSHFLDMMYVEFMKNFFSPIRTNWAVLGSFRHPEPKNLWFPLSRHDVRRVHGKDFFRRFEGTDRCWSHFSLVSPKTFDSHFLDMMYVEFIKNFFLADSSELMGVRVISASWAQKRLITTF